MNWVGKAPCTERTIPRVAKVASRTRSLTRLRVTRAMAEEWRLEDGCVAQVSMGGSGPIRALVQVTEAGEGAPATALFPGSNFRGTVEPNTALRVEYDEAESTVRLGPVIGLLTIDTRVMFGPQGGTFKDLMSVGRRRCALVYAFTPEGVDWANQVIVGYQYVLTPGAKVGRWVRRRFPMPDVVYNRIPRRVDERRSHVASALRRLRAQPNLHLFNTRFLNKWEVQKRLVAAEELRERIPTTNLWKGPESLLRILHEHSQAFMKPVSNSLGNGAMRIRRTQRGYSWELNIPGKGTRRCPPTTLAKVCSLAANQVGRVPYLVQRCVDLARYNGRPFDVRILVQKDEYGSWRTTGMAARVALPNRITTHIPNGGRAHAIGEALRHAFEGTEIEPREVECALSETAELAARAVDTRANELYGELSLDVGVDTHGHIWIFEVNAKPFRFDEEKIRQLSLRKLIGYSAYVSGFGCPDQATV